MLHNFLTAATSVAPVIAVLAVIGLSACAAYRPRTNPVSEPSDTSTKENA